MGIACRLLDDGSAKGEVVDTEFDVSSPVAHGAATPPGGNGRDFRSPVTFPDTEIL
jgi:hypothetical protein